MSKANIQGTFDFLQDIKDILGPGWHVGVEFEEHPKNTVLVSLRERDYRFQELIRVGDQHTEVREKHFLEKLHRLKELRLSI